MNLQLPYPCDPSFDRTDDCVHKALDWPLDGMLIYGASRDYSTANMRKVADIQRAKWRVFSATL
eukprot:IDg6251t1